MENRNYYAIIPANVRYSDIPDGAKLLYGEITALTNEKGYCWASNSYFENLYNKKKCTIIRWINALEEKGFIHRKIIYKEGTKQVEQRIITIAPVGEVPLGGGSKNDTTPSCKNDTTPSIKNATYNNTYINNTRVSEDTLANKDLICESESTPDEENEGLIKELKDKVETNNVAIVVSEYKRICTNLKPFHRLSSVRADNVKARLKVYEVTDIIKAFEIANWLDFMQGKKGNWNGATFDWFFANDENIQKVLDGYYSNKASPIKDTNKFCKIEQREYDFNMLEKKLLGG